jgi:uncharacterized protein YbjT (DUF2867 family)
MEIDVILVTGATGRPGSAVVDEFARRGEPVRALVRDPAKATRFDAFPTVEVVQGDMLWPHTLGAALDGVERVLMISNAGPIMLETQCTFIDAAVAAGVEHIVKFSGKDSIAGFDVTRFRSVRSHDQIERYLTASAEGWTVLAPSQFMQVYFEEISTIVAAGEIRLPLGDTTLAPVDIADIAQVAHAVLTTEGHRGKRYGMTGPEALTMSEVATSISAAVGTPVRYIDVDPEDKRREWLDAGYPPERAAAFLQLFEERKRLGRSSVDLSTHTRFGIAPTTFREFALRNADAFRGRAAYAVTPA